MMLRIRLLQIDLLPFLLALTVLVAWSENSLGQTNQNIAVTYQTTDGWTIRGTLVLPERTTRRPVPGVVLVTEPVNRLRTTYHSTLETMLVKEEIAVLIIDVRGTAGSYGKKDFVKFTVDEIDGLQLDIKGAVQFLASQEIVDGNRIGIVGSGLTAHYGILEAFENSSVQAVVSITTTELSEKARKYLGCNRYCLNYEAARKDIPVLTIVGVDQEKGNQRIESEPYYLSENVNSRLLFGVQRGTNMLNRPGGLREATTQWLVDNLKSLPTETDVTFRSADGWDLYGTLFMPGNMNENTETPGVVFVHGYNHSSEGMYYLAREVAKTGIAALTFDWRGTRKSVDEKRGEVGINLPDEERNKIFLDVKAAVDLLASQDRVDGSRLGLLASTATNNHAVRAAMGDSRIKTMVGLSFYAPAPDVKQYLQTAELPLFIIASTEDVNADGGSLAEGSKEVYEVSNSKQTEFILFDNAGRSTGMLKTNPELVGMINRWFKDKLAR